MNILVWLFQLVVSWIHTIVLYSLRLGPVPQHVAIIMDGNRRWAEKNHLERMQGHVYGYQRLEETLDWCEKLGVKAITVFAFSIDNFKRSPNEVTAIMKLAEEKFTKMLDKNGSSLDKHQCAVKLLGKWDLLPEYVKQSANRVIEYSGKYNRMYMNFCFPYTATEEITQSIQKTVIGNLTSNPDTTQIENQLESNMYTTHVPPVDLMIRTSGETRLSDFLTWQSSASAVYSFKNVMWPDFSLWNLFETILSYQYNYKTIKNKWNLNSTCDHEYNKNVNYFQVASVTS